MTDGSGALGRRTIANAGMLAGALPGRLAAAPARRHASN